jgi:hypothetical protein
MYTHITMLIDESGSMSHLRNTVLESIRGLITKQQEIPDPCTITISTFDGTRVVTITGAMTVGGSGGSGWSSGTYNAPKTHTVQAVIRTPVRMGNIQKATFDSYNPNGSTPLLEALCREIDATGHDLAALPEAARPQKVIFVVMTDGEENASGVEYTLNAVKERIQRQTNTYKWEFLFLGANIDAFSVGQALGFAGSSISTYNATSAGYGATTTTLSDKFSAVRSGAVTSTAFTKQEQDYLSTTK